VPEHSCNLQGYRKPEENNGPRIAATRTTSHRLKEKHSEYNLHNTFAHSRNTKQVNAFRKTEGRAPHMEF
jgi:hypothetical protein